MLNLPSSTLVNLKVPKKNFYEKLRLNERVKRLFAAQIESIVWKHKLSRDTIRLEPKGDIEEIQVFEMHLKQPECSEEVLRCIDQAIPYPIVHVLMYKEQAKLVIAYKKRNAKDENRAVVFDYYGSPWMNVEDLSSIQLVKGWDLREVYENFIRRWLTIKSIPDEPLEVLLDRLSKIERFRKECEQLQAKILRERQSHRKVELNLELQRKQKLLQNLLGPQQGEGDDNEEAHYEVG